MKSLKDMLEKNKYQIPTVEILSFDVKDVLCASDEQYDNDFDAGELEP